LHVIDAFGGFLYNETKYFLRKAMVLFRRSIEDEQGRILEQKGLVDAEKKKALVNAMQNNAGILSQIDRSVANIQDYDDELELTRQRIGMNPFGSKKQKEHNALLDRILERDTLRKDLKDVESELVKVRHQKGAVDARLARIQERLERARFTKKWHSMWSKHVEKKVQDLDNRISDLEEQSSTAREGLVTADRSAETIKTRFHAAKVEMDSAWEAIFPYLDELGYSPALNAAIDARDMGAVLEEMGLLSPIGNGRLFSTITGRLPAFLGGQTPPWLDAGAVQTWEERRILAENLRRLVSAYEESEVYRNSSTVLEMIDNSRQLTRDKIDALLSLTPQNQAATQQKIASIREQEAYIDVGGDWDTGSMQISPETEEVIIVHRNTGANVRFGYEQNGPSFSYILPGGGRTSSLGEAANAQLAVERTRFIQEQIFIGFGPTVLIPHLNLVLTPGAPATAADITAINYTWTTDSGDTGSVSLALADIPMNPQPSGNIAGRPQFTIQGPQVLATLESRLLAAADQGLRASALLGPAGAAATPLQGALTTAFATPGLAGTMISITVQQTTSAPRRVEAVNIDVTHPGTGHTHSVQLTDASLFPVSITPAAPGVPATVSIDMAALSANMAPHIQAAEARMAELTYLQANGGAIALNMATAAQTYPYLRNPGAAMTYVAATPTAPAHFTWGAPLMHGLTLTNWTGQTVDADTLDYTRDATGAVNGTTFARTLQTMEDSLTGFKTLESTLATEIRTAMKANPTYAPKEKKIHRISAPAYNATASEWQMTIHLMNGTEVTIPEADLAGLTATYTAPTVAPATPAPAAWNLTINPAFLSAVDALIP